MITSFDRLMRQADLHAIAERALQAGARELYDKLVHDAEHWDAESIALHLAEVRTEIPALTDDVAKFLEGTPLSPVNATTA